MSLILHTADVHLDSPMAGLQAYDGAPTEALRLATRRSFVKIIDLALEESVDLVLIAGDLYDRDPRDGNTGLFLCNELRRLRRAGVEVVILNGNHDADALITHRLPLPEGVTTLSSRKPETVRFPELGIAVHGQSYGHREVTRDLAARYPDPVDGMLNIGLLHTALTGREGHASYAPCSVESLAGRGYSYWALGHVHEFEVVSKDPWIVFSGCPQGRGIRECGAKGVVVVETDGDQVVSVEPHCVDVARWEQLVVDLSGAEDRDEAFGRVRSALMRLAADAEGRVLACRVTLTGRTSLDRLLGARPGQLADQVRALALDAGDGQVWVESVRCATEPEAAPTDLAARRDPIARLLADSRALAADPARLVEQVPAIGELARQLPSGSLNEDQTGPDDPAWLSERVAAAERLLLGRLGTGLEAA